METADKPQCADPTGSPVVNSADNAQAPAAEHADEPKKVVDLAKKGEIESYVNDSLGCLSIAFVMFGVVLYFLHLFG